MKRNIAALVLAAGSSSRMGTPKQLLRVGSRTLLRRAVEEAVASAVRSTFVVLGPENERMRDELRDLPVSFVENARGAQGIGTSVSAGVAAIAKDRPAFDAVVLMTCDQPHVSSITIDRLIAEHEASATALVATAYAQTVGVPALFAQRYFSALVELPPENGAKQILLRHHADVAVVECEAAAVDLDTPADYERFTRARGATS